MKKVLVKTLLSVTLGFGFVAGSATSSLAAEIQGTKTAGENLYVIAFKNELPKDYKVVIEKAGGQVVKVLPEVGGIQAQSDNSAISTKS